MYVIVRFQFSFLSNINFQVSIAVITILKNLVLEPVFVHVLVPNYAYKAKLEVLQIGFRFQILKNTFIFKF